MSAYHRILELARIIAKLAESEEIKKSNPYIWQKYCNIVVGGNSL